MHMKLLDPDFLSRGTERQRAAFAELSRLGIFARLAEFGPVLAGTVPIDVDIESSDLDIICSAVDLESFAGLVRSFYGAEPGFALEHKLIRSRPTVIARFRTAQFPVEIFAQNAAVLTQSSVLH